MYRRIERRYPLLPVYKRIELRRPTLPVPSTLYSLDPIGLGTPSVECLTSYISRLANAHFVLVRQLYAEYQPANAASDDDLESGASRSPDKKFALSQALNGATRRAESWVSKLERLTLRPDLRFLTLLPWQGIISTHFILRTHRAWCPTCFDSWQQSGGTIYEPLLWMIEEVKVCCQHERRLEHLCPHCKRRSDVLTTFSLPGYCSRCRGWLGLVNDTRTAHSDKLESKELTKQLWTVDTIRDWIAAIQLPSFRPSKENIKLMINGWVERLAVGHTSAFARFCGLYGDLIHVLLKDASIPRFDALLKICWHMNVPLTVLATAQDVDRDLVELKLKSKFLADRSLDFAMRRRRVRLLSRESAAISTHSSQPRRI